MAISKNLWLNGTKQKLGGAVTYTLKGQQIIRKEAAKVSNPRSTAQMNQRVRLANLVDFYRANQLWMKRGAFENKKQTQSDYNAFVSRNIQSSTIALTKAEALAGAVVVAPYQVTDGSLERINASVATNVLSIPLANLTAGNSPMTSDVSMAILENYPSLRKGDQISIIVLLNKRDSAGIPRVTVFANEFILDDDNSEPISTYVSVGTRVRTISATESALVLNVQPESGESVAFVVCASRSTSNGIKVSPSSVIMGDTTFLTGYSSEEQFEKAIISYGESTENFLDSTSVVAGNSNTTDGGDNQGGSGSGDPSDVTP